MQELQQDLHDLWSALDDAWQELSDVWRDSAADHYESRHWEPLEGEVRAYLTAVDDLTELMAHVKAVL